MENFLIRSWEPSEDSKKGILLLPSRLHSQPTIQTRQWEWLSTDVYVSFFEQQGQDGSWLEYCHIAYLGALQILEEKSAAN